MKSDVVACAVLGVAILALLLLKAHQRDEPKPQTIQPPHMTAMTFKLMDKDYSTVLELHPNGDLVIDHELVLLSTRQHDALKKGLAEMYDMPEGTHTR